jgi:nitroreductase
MQLAAWARGIGSCIASIYEPEKARAILGVPDDQNFRYALSFGYPAPNPNPPTGLKKGGRLPLEEVVRWEHW